VDADRETFEARHSEGWVVVEVEVEVEDGLELGCCSLRCALWRVDNSRPEVVDGDTSESGGEDADESRAESKGAWQDEPTQTVKLPSGSIHPLF
jgi:hypothetical protein